MSLLPRLIFLCALVASGALLASLLPSNEWPDQRGSISAEVFHSAKNLNLQQALQLPDDAWQQIDAEGINFGFSEHIFWFRLNIEDLALDNTDRWMLEMNYPLLDRLSLFIVAEDRAQQTFITGNSLPFASRPVAVPEFVFPLTGLQQAQWIYIKVESESSIQLPISLYKENSYWQQRLAFVTFDAAFYAVLASMVIYNLLIYVLSRDSIFLIYSVTISSFALLMASTHGWTFALLWPNAPALNDQMLLLSLTATATCMAYFGVTFLRLKTLNRKIYHIFIGYIVLALIGAIASFFTPYTVMIRALTALAIVMSLSALFNGAYLWHATRSRDVLLFFLAFSLLIFGFLVYSLQKFGILPVTLITEHAIEIGGTAQVILLALSMAERHNRERHALMAAQDVIINMQREANEVLDQKVKERTQDLEKVNHRLQQESTTDALTQIRNRRCFDQQFYTLFYDACREKTPLSLLLIDIDHFKQFNDNHGHQIGDLVLQKVATTLDTMIKRPMDEVYRYGGEEFATLLPDTPGEGAALIAEQLRQQVECLTVRHGGDALSVTISIGFHSQIPTEPEQLHQHYDLADQALYRAKRDGRNCVRGSHSLVPSEELG